MHDLNKWRGIDLIDVGSKMVSVMLDVKAQKCYNTI